MKMIKELKNRMDSQSGKLKVFNKELENIKNSKMELKTIVTEMKSTVEGISSRIN